MPHFSPVQCADLVDLFWKGDGLRCPVDGTLLASHFQPLEAGYLLALACLCCGKKAQVTRLSDPRRFMFRCWSNAERAEMEAACAGSTRPACPICQISLVDPPAPGTPFRSLECPRCGNSHILVAICAAGALVSA